MKKIIAMILAVLMLLALTACGGNTEGGTAPANSASGSAENNGAAAAPAESSEPAASEPEQESSSGGIAPATDGTLTIGKADIAVMINGKSVPMPYKLKELEAAGVPADEARDGTELNPGDFLSASLYLDENEDYLLIPAYYNGGSSAISIMDAEAEEITMTTYSDEPKDQGVSVLGIAFGLPRSEVKAMLGNPIYDAGDYLEWHVDVPELNYEGTLSMYFTEDSDSAGVSQLDLTVFPK